MSDLHLDIEGDCAKFQTGMWILVERYASSGSYPSVCANWQCAKTSWGYRREGDYSAYRQLSVCLPESGKHTDGYYAVEIRDNIGTDKVAAAYIWPDNKVSVQNFERAFCWRVEGKAPHSIPLILRIPEYGEWARNVSETDLEAAVTLVEQLQKPAPKASVELLLKHGTTVGLPILTDLVKTFAKK